MYWSYTGARNLYGELTNDTSATNLTNGDSYINAHIGRLLGKKPWSFLYRDGTVNTVANTQSVEVPANIKKVTGVVVESGTTRWTPREAPSVDFWNRLNYTIATAHTADYPDWYFPQAGKVYFHPTPSTARTVTITGRIGFNRLNIADYTTGTASAITSSATVTGNGSSWTNAMVGRFIRLTQTNAAGSGDDEWYEIAAVASATSLTLKKPYAGLTTSSGPNYTIGQIGPIPDGYQEAPIYRAAQTYYSAKNIPGAAERAVLFKELADDLESQLSDDYGSPTDNVVIENESLLDDQTNPNVYVRI